MHCKHFSNGIVAIMADPDELVQLRDPDYPAQLALDGSETPYPMRRITPLTDRQREVIGLMRACGGSVRPVEVGRLMHAGTRHPSGLYPIIVDAATTSGPLSCCKFASSDGHDALRRLERRGIVERVRRGLWRLVDHQEDW